MSASYEVHVQKAGRWRIDSVFDDRDFAIAAAKELAEKPIIEAVRVAVETWDSKTQRAVSRTVFRTSRQQAAISAQLEQQKQKAAEERRNRHAANRLSGADRARIERARRRAARNRLIASAMLTLVALLAAGAGGIYVLRLIGGGQLGL